MNTLFATPGYHDPTPSRPMVLRCWMSGCLPHLDLPSTVRSTVCQGSRRSRRRVSRQDWGLRAGAQHHREAAPQVGGRQQPSRKGVEEGHPEVPPS